MMLTKTIGFGAKNFYKQLGLSQNFTIAGLFRRWERQYPRAMKATKLGIIFFIITSSSMLVIPGTDIPLQRPLKCAMCKKAQQFCKFWYIQSGMPDVLAYTLTTYQILFYQLKQGIYSPQVINYYLSRVNSVLQPKDIQLYRVKDAVRMQNIANGIELLHKIVLRFQLSQDPHSLLKNPLILSQFQQIIDNSILAIEDQVKEADKKYYESCLKIFEYLFKFEPKQNQASTLQKLIKLLNSKNKGFIAASIIKNEELKRQLKHVYGLDEQSKTKVLKILQLVQDQRKLHIS